MPSRIIATCLALIAFAMTIVLGMAVGNPPITIVWRATLMMLVVWAIGSVLGAMAQHVITENIASYKLDHPLVTEAEIAQGIAPEAIDDDIEEMATQHERDDEAVREEHLATLAEKEKLDSEQDARNENDNNETLNNNAA